MTMIRTGRTTVVATTILLGAALLVAAVVRLREGGAVVGAPAPSPGAPVPAASPSPFVASPVVAGPQSASVAGEVTIHLTDQGFAPSYVESTNGHDLTITLVNNGSRPHAFRLDHYRIAVRLDPGETTTVVIHQPDLGDFTYYSDAPGDAGMEGTLTFYI